MLSRPLRYDPASDRFVEYVADETSGEFGERVTWDPAPLLDRNKRLANNGDGWNAAKDLRAVASIPLDLVRLWQAQGFDVFTCDTRDLLKRLNDPELRHLRTANWRC